MKEGKGFFIIVLLHYTFFSPFPPSRRKILTSNDGALWKAVRDTRMADRSPHLSSVLMGQGH